jgi:hypothetical protein
MKNVQSNDDNLVKGYLTIKTFRGGELVRQSERLPNKVVSGAGGYGRNLIARQLAGDVTYSIEIDSAALGSNSTAPADSDTGLNTAVLSDIPITNMTVTNNVLAVDVFVADGNLTNGTYREFGLFCNGRLFARIIISPDYTKASGEDTLFTYELTLAG